MLLNQNSKWITIVSSTIILVLSLSFLSPISIQAQDNDFSRNFEWEYKDYTYYLNLTIPQNLYDAYKDVPAATRTRTGISGYGFLATTEDPYMQSLAAKLNQSATENGYDEFETVSFILAYVQSLQYTSDSVTTGHDEYPRFPIETLVDDGGDCEDTSILFATLTLILGYGAVYISPPDHLAVGVLGQDLEGYYYTYNQARYYYCETTGTGWGIGDLPEDLQNATALIYPIKETQQYLVPITFTLPSPSPTPLPTTSTQPSSPPQATYTATEHPQTTPSENTSPTPPTPEFTSIAAIAALVAASSLTALLAKRKNNKNS